MAGSIAATLAAALTEVVQRVQRSLVIVQNGRRGAGAGIIWRANGLIVTNNHVVGDGQVHVTLSDGREYPGRLIIRDAEIDLAALQIEASGLPVALVADSHGLRVGQPVLALGHPWGQRNAVSVGIISALSEVSANGRRRALPVIRSDVRLAPGNSGGPLVNLVGGVIGINTLIVGGDQGIAIPSHVVNTLLEQAA